MNRTTSVAGPARSATHDALHFQRQADGATVHGRLRPRERPQTQAGDLLGPYRLIELIGHGSMGRVYRAEHVMLGRPLAVKVLHRHHARRQHAIARLFQEARASSQIRHRNIVDVVDYREIDRETVCIAMEFVSGPSLRRLMDTPGALPPARALDILAQICDGLSAAHDAGVVHRDLKPDNVMVTRAPAGGDLVKIVDFGLAMLRSGEDGPRAAAGQVFGTPPYMSPEQSTGASVDGRADLYSLGAIAYEIFTGKPPFAAATFREYMFKHATVLPEPPSNAPGHRVPDHRVEALIMRCLAKNPLARYQSADALGDHIRSIRSRLLTRGPTLAQRVAVSLFVVAAAGLIGALVAAASGSPRGGTTTQAAAAEPVARQLPDQRSIVRLVSQPPGQVYLRGRAERLCDTPCALAVAPGSDRSARAVFVVRRPGYREQSIAVDPAAPPGKVSVQLERERPRGRTARPVDPDATLNPYRDGID